MLEKSVSPGVTYLERLYGVRRCMVVRDGSFVSERGPWCQGDVPDVIRKTCLMSKTCPLCQNGVLSVREGSLVSGTSQECQGGGPWC